MLHLAPQFGGVQALRASVGRQIYAIPTRTQAQRTCGGADAGGGGDACIGSRTQRDGECLCGYQYYIQVRCWGGRARARAVVRWRHGEMASATRRPL